MCFVLRVLGLGLGLGFGVWCLRLRFSLFGFMP